VGAVVEGVDLSSVRVQQLVQAKVDPIDVVARVKPTVNPGLVRHADHEIAMGASEGERGADTAEELEATGLSKVVKVRVQGAVAVDEERPTRPRDISFLCGETRHRPAEPQDGISVHPRPRSVRGG
jgi:hypothetical protein